MAFVDLFTSSQNLQAKAKLPLMLPLTLNGVHLLPEGFSGHVAARLTDFPVDDTDSV